MDLTCYHVPLYIVSLASAHGQMQDHLVGGVCKNKQQAIGHAEDSTCFVRHPGGDDVPTFCWQTYSACSQKPAIKMVDRCTPSARHGHAWQSLPLTGSRPMVEWRCLRSTDVHLGPLTAIPPLGLNPATQPCRPRLSMRSDCHDQQACAGHADPRSSSC